MALVTKFDSLISSLREDDNHDAADAMHEMIRYLIDARAAFDLLEKTSTDDMAVIAGGVNMAMIDRFLELKETE